MKNQYPILPYDVESAIRRQGGSVIEGEDPYGRPTFHVEFPAGTTKVEVRGHGPSGSNVALTDWNIRLPNGQEIYEQKCKWQRGVTGEIGIPQLV